MDCLTWHEICINLTLADVAAGRTEARLPKQRPSYLRINFQVPGGLETQDMSWSRIRMWRESVKIRASNEPSQRFQPGEA